MFFLKFKIANPISRTRYVKFDIPEITKILSYSTQNLKSKLFLMLLWLQELFSRKNFKIMRLPEIIHFLFTNPSFAFKHDIESFPIPTARRWRIERIIVVVFLIFCFPFFIFIYLFFIHLFFYLFSFYCHVGFNGAMRFNPHHGISWSIDCNNTKNRFCNIFLFGMYNFWYISIDIEGAALFYAWIIQICLLAQVIFTYTHSKIFHTFRYSLTFSTSVV